jgi:hypothetical protein
MANTYIVTSLTTSGNTVNVSGTVNGVSVQTAYPASTTFASALLFQAFIGPLMLAQAPLPSLAGFQGTWSA